MKSSEVPLRVRLLLVFIHEHHLFVLIKSQSLGLPKSLGFELVVGGCRVGSIIGEALAEKQGTFLKVQPLSHLCLPQKRRVLWGSVSGDHASVNL